MAKRTESEIKYMMRNLALDYRTRILPIEVWYSDQLKTIQSQCGHQWSEITGDHGPIIYECDLCRKIRGSEAPHEQ